MDSIIIKEDGIYGRRWNPDDQRYDLKKADLSKGQSILRLWNMSVKLDGVITLRLIINLLKQSKNGMSLVSDLTACNISNFSDELDNKIRDDSTKLHRVEVSKIVQINSFRKPSKIKRIIRKLCWWHKRLSIEDSIEDDSTWLEDFVSVSGISDPDEHGCDHCALEFTPWSELADVPINISPVAEVWDDSAWRKNPKKYKSTKADASITFGEFLTAMFWELCWFSCPSERDKQLNKLISITDDAIAHPENLIPFEEVFKKIEKKKADSI